MTRAALLRVRYHLLHHGAVLIAVLLLAGALALGAAGLLHGDPPTTEVTDHVDRQTVASNVSIRAVVSEDSALYGAGRVLTDQPVYLRGETSSPTLVVRTSVPDGGETTVAQRLSVVYRVSRDGEAFWRNETVLAATETTASGTVETRTTLNLTAVRERTAAIGRTVGGAGTVHATLRLDVDYATPRYEGSLSTPIDLAISEEWYQVGTPRVSRTHSRPVTETITLPRRSGVGYREVGALGAAFVGLGIASAVAAWRIGRRHDPDDVAHERHRVRYAAWISTGTLPADLGERSITVDSLESLVDVAIDTDGRVVHDEGRGRYAVLDGSTAYVYDDVGGYVFDHVE